VADERWTLWAGRLGSASERAAAPLWAREGDPSGFADEQGHRRSVDEPFLTHCLQAQPRERDRSDAGSADVQLWRAVHDPAIDVDRLIQRDGGRGSNAQSGFVLRRDDAITVEVATESELCGLHALWLLARLRGRADWREVCFGAVAMLVEHLEADNATAHPWGVHVFVAAGVARGHAEAEMYAGALLHACQAVGGRPDALSGYILADAARELRLAQAFGAL
jgi:hypothetical protein